MRAVMMIGGAGMLVLSAVSHASVNGPISGTPPAQPSMPTPVPAPAPLPPIVTPAPSPAPVIVPVYNWSGFYMGANLGGGWSNQDATIAHSEAVGSFPPLTGSARFGSSGSGIIGGGHFGFNYQVPSGLGDITRSWVAGIEADIDAADISHPGAHCLQTAQGTIFQCGTTHSTLDDFGTVRGRLGYAFDNVLVYGTGGWAWADTSAKVSTTCLGTGCPAVSLPISQPPVHFSSSPNGWSAGGGIEWGFLPNWSVRAEYLHLQFDGISLNASFAGTTGGASVSGTSNIRVNLGVDIARVGFTYRFNWL